MSDATACYRRLRELGYTRRASFRIALWAVNPDLPVYPEKKE